MIDHSHFHAEIADAPDYDAPKRIYADWLEERGDKRSEAWRWIAETGRKPYVGCDDRGRDRIHWSNNRRNPEEACCSHVRFEVFRKCKRFNFWHWVAGCYRTKLGAYLDLVQAFVAARKDGWTPELIEHKGNPDGI